MNAEGPIVLGGGTAGAPLAASAHSLFGPRGICLFDADGPLWVADSGHHRLLGWSRLPAAADATPDWCIGQPDWRGEARNAGGAPHAASLNVPVGLCAYGDGIAVADSWNHRVLIWHLRPQRWNQPADLVLGQPDFHAVEANRGRSMPAADTLHWPSGLCAHGDRLWVADTGNRRVLCWDGPVTDSGQASDGVMGQLSMAGRDQGAGRDLDAAGMVWPHACTIWRGGLVVADAGANRLMIWDRPPRESGRACDRVFGQSDDRGRLHNRGRPAPDAESLSMPYGICAAGSRLIVADTANSRLLALACERGGNPVAAGLLGQPDYASGGDNRWQAVAEDSLCWPYGVAACADWLAIADSGNNRVLLWRGADAL